MHRPVTAEEAVKESERGRERKREKERERGGSDPLAMVWAGPSCAGFVCDSSCPPPPPPAVRLGQLVIAVGTWRGGRYLPAWILEIGHTLAWAVLWTCVGHRHFL